MGETSYRCPGCYLPMGQCVCQTWSKIACDIQVIIIRHHLEGKKASNTARVVGATLEGAQIVEYGGPGVPPPIVLPEGAGLLYPGPGAPTDKPPNSLVVLDGSWSQTRRMFQKLPQVQGLPRVSLPPPSEPLPRLRRGQVAHQMSTAEAVVRALSRLGQDAAAQHLEVHLRELVRRFSLPRRKGPGRNHR